MSEEGRAPNVYTSDYARKFDYTRWAQDSEDMFMNIEAGLRGEVWDAELGKFVEDKNLKPIMSAKGVKFVMDQIRSFATRNTSLSNVSEDRVMGILEDSWLSFNRALFFNSVEFGLNPETYEAVFTLYMNITEFAARRAVDEGEREWVNRMESVHRQIGGEEGEKKGGLFSIFKR